MIFFHLRSGSNFNDERRETQYGAGQFGLGVKGAIILSKRATLTILDHRNKVMYEQTSSNNNQSIEPPVIKTMTKIPGPLSKFQEEKTQDEKEELKLCAKYDRVKIECQIDRKRFDPISNIKEWNRIVLSRVVMLAGCIDHQGPHGKVKVMFNGQPIKISSFVDFMSCFHMNYIHTEIKLNHQEKDVWTIGLCPSSTDKFQHTSFVNSVHTFEGGTHIHYVMDELLLPNVMLQLISKIKSLKNQTPTMLTKLKRKIKDKMRLLLHARIPGPTFEGQLKESCKSKIPKQTDQDILPMAFVKKIIKFFNLVELVEEWLNMQSLKSMAKSGGQKKSGESVVNQKKRLHQYTKLHDAEDAGTKQKRGTSLFLVEGDSALNLIMCAFSVLPRSKVGIFPLRGKLMNVSEKSKTTVANNKEIQAIVQIMGLDYNQKEYNNVKTLRYDKLIIAVDQDVDATHIFCLIVNFLHYFWPSLLYLPGFLFRFITPSIVATSNKQKFNFYSFPDYLAWSNARSESDLNKKWTIKYLKGLATSTSEEGKDYFENFASNCIEFYCSGKNCEEMIQKTMGDKKTKKTNVEKFRKTWIADYDPESFVPINYREQKKLSIYEFFNQELILFAIQSLVRAIPSLIDGFKESQRKILHVAMHLKKHEIKVSQFASEVAAKTKYRHGETSLCQCVTQMAQQFVGSNNVNLLLPKGQFGSKAIKDSYGSPRYIMTALAPIVPHIFISKDEPLLEILIDEDEPVEPKYFLPIVPMILINGGEGIGMGHSTFIPPFHPSHILSHIRMWLNNIEKVEAVAENSTVKEPLPYYHGFTGTIVPNTRHSFKVYGILRQVDDLTFRITELPPNKYHDGLKNVLTDLESKNLIDTFIEYNNEYQTNVLVKFANEEQKLECEKQDKFHSWYHFFDLIQNISIKNMTLFNSKQMIHTYDSVSEILDEFCTFRLAIYTCRKNQMIQEIQNQLIKLQNGLRFIEAVVNGELDLKQQEEDLNINNWLENLGYLRISSSYHYLLSISISQMTKKEINKIRDNIQKLETELEFIQNKSEKDMWLDELEIFEQKLNEHFSQMDDKRNINPDEFSDEEIVDIK